TAPFEVAGDRVDGAVEDLDTGKADDPEVVRLGPVEPGAVRDQDVLFSQQVQDEFLVAGDPEHLAVEAGEAVQRTLRGDTADARDGVEFIRGDGELALGPPGGVDHVGAPGRVLGERQRDGVLAGDVGAGTHVGERRESLDQIGGVVEGPGRRGPAGPVTAHAVRLGQTAEGQAQDVVPGRERRVVVPRAGEDQPLVYLVGQQEQAVSPGDVGHAADRLLAVHGAGGVVGVDQHQGGGARGDLGLDVRQGRVPAVRLVGEVVHGDAAGEVHRPGPRGVVGGGHQDLVARVDERLQDQRDEFAHAVAQEHVVGRDLLDAAPAVVARHGLTGGGDPAGVRVRLRRHEVAVYGVDDLGARLEPEGVHVAQVEAQHVVALGLEAHRLGEDGSAHVVADVAEAAGLVEALHGDHPTR